VGFGGRCIFLEIFGWSIIFRKSKKNIKNSIIAEQTNLKKSQNKHKVHSSFVFLFQNSKSTALGRHQQAPSSYDPLKAFTFSAIALVRNVA
jgi:hypothetical protein